MKIVQLCLVFCATVFIGYAHAQAPSSRSDFTLSLSDVPLHRVVSLVYGEVLKEPFVVDESVKGAAVSISFRGATPTAVREVLDAYLQGRGLARTVVSGVNMFGPANKLPSQPGSTPALKDDSPSGAIVKDAKGVTDLSVAMKSKDAEGFAAFRVQHRSANDLAKTLGALFGADSTAVQVANDELILVKGSTQRLSTAKLLFDLLDTESAEVLAKIMVVEYGNTDDDGAGLFGAVKILGGRLSLSVGENLPFVNALTLKGATIEAVASAVSQDSRFAVLDSSRLRIVSGRTGRIVIGQDVPILSKAEVDAKGNPVSSINYRSAGLIVEMKPTITGDRITADLTQEISGFVQTQTSKIDSPTLNKRTFATTFSSRFGELVVLGGLDQSRDTDARGGLFGLRLSNSKKQSRTTVVVFVEFGRV